MTRPSIFLVSFFLLFSSKSFAKISGLLHWQENGVNVILPKIEGKNANTVPDLYKSALEKSNAYKASRPFFGKQGSIADSFQKGKISHLPKTQITEERVPFAIFANSPPLMNPNGKPFQHFNKALGAAGASAYVIPFGIDSLLTKKQDLKTYFDLITQQFTALIAPGGDDIDPALYGEKNTYSINTNLPLDQSEILLIQTFMNFGQGVFYGICRGHQAYTVAMGGSLIQDLPPGLSPNVIHRPTKNPDGSMTSSWHSVTLTDKDNVLYQAVEKDTFLVNSRHHQAVKSIPVDKGEVIALAGGNVIESIQKKDSEGHLKALTFQFHPEDMETPESEKIFKLMIDQARQVRHIKKDEKKTK